jgi:hypothetical protein
MSKFAELIERLEKAPGPDRELDRAIADLVFNLEWKPYGPRARKCWGYRRGTDDVVFYGEDSIPTFTASIDAALTLVPPTYTTSVHSDEDETLPTGITLQSFAPDQHEAEVIYFPTWNVEPPPLGVGYAGSLAIALCIAALKAREAQS